MGRAMKSENPHSFWPTPKSAVLPLLPHLPRKSKFMEPCAGNAALVDHLLEFGHWPVWQSDIEPRNEIVSKYNALKLFAPNPFDPDAIKYWIRNIGADFIITNPPFSRNNIKTLKEMIRLFAAARPTWLLLPAGFKYNAYAKEFMPYCEKIVAIGRVIWIEGTEEFSTKDYAWFLFDKNFKGQTQFFINNGESHA